MESFKRYQQGLARQIKDLLSEALSLIMNAGGDLACKPLSMACDLVDEAVPYCIENGILSDAYIIVNSVCSIFAEMGKSGVVPEDEEVQGLLIQLKMKSIALEEWQNKGGCPQSVIREFESTGQKINMELFFDDGKSDSIDSGNDYIDGKSDSLGVGDLDDSMWPYEIKKPEAKAILQKLVDEGYLTISDGRLKWEKGISLLGWCVHLLCKKFKIGTKPWKKFELMIKLPDGSSWQSAKNVCSKQKRPIGGEILDDIVGVEKKPKKV